MSQFVGGSLPQFILARNERRAVGRIGEGEGEGVDCCGVQDFVTGWWPGGGGLLGDYGVDVALLESQWWGRPDVTNGADSRLGYQGITRDVNNSPLLGATVKIFRTSDDAKMSPDIVSDTGTGEYIISTTDYAPHWLKVEKAGSPPVQGVSVNTIYPNV